MDDTKDVKRVLWIVGHKEHGYETPGIQVRVHLWNALSQGDIPNHHCQAVLMVCRKPFALSWFRTCVARPAPNRQAPAVFLCGLLPEKPRNL